MSKIIKVQFEIYPHSSDMPKFAVTGIKHGDEIDVSNKLLEREIIIALNERSAEIRKTYGWRKITE